MNKYLLDTNLCIYFLKGLFNLQKKIEEVGAANCFISEITLAELKFGAENSSRKIENSNVIEDFITKFTVLPIYNCLDVYAKEKARNRKKGIVIDDFDLLIGATAIVNNLVLVTNNEKHFANLQKITIENWVAGS